MFSVIFITGSRLSFQVFVHRKVANIKHEFMELKCPKSAGQPVKVFIKIFASDRKADIKLKHISLMV